MTGLIKEPPNTPTEPDGKPVMVVSPATEGTMTWITSQGDDDSPTPPATGRGDGAEMCISCTGSGSFYSEWQFTQPVELHDGQIWYTPVGDWNNADRFSLSVIMPANTPTVADPVGSGNCVLVEVVPSSGMHVIIPHPTGTHNIDLDDAVPAPAGRASDGYFDMDSWTGVVTVAENPGEAGWQLFDFEIKSYFIKNVAMGNPLGVFDIDVYKAELCHQTWKFRLDVERDTSGSAEVGGWTMCFRPDST